MRRLIQMTLPVLLFFFAGFVSATGASAVQALPDVVTLNTPRQFPAIAGKTEWEKRARTIREQILVSSGLWPWPQKTLLQAKIFGKVSHDDYSVEKVCFQSYPGFYVAGNLYRPLTSGAGPFPAVLVAHGHWEDGRLTDDKAASFPGLCINLAKRGMIAFSFDMVGYNDTHFPESPQGVPFMKVHTNFARYDPACELWNVSLMGLQTWNSVRALDFLASLPDADPQRLACTGASGGATQTILLGAIDDRLAAQAPVVMVSHTMQGGCLCENMPGLRIDFSNMEIAAAACPRPQLLVGATGDWTKTMMEIEGPAILRIYDLFQRPQNLRFVRFDFKHNYNQTSREAVYRWFDTQLLSLPDAPSPELPFQKEPDSALRVFPDGKLPPDAISQRSLIENLIESHRALLRSAQPKDSASCQAYKEMIEPAWLRTFHLNHLGEVPQNFRDADSNSWIIQWAGESPGSRLRFFRPAPANPPAQAVAVVLVDPKGSGAFCDESGVPKGLASLLLARQFCVAVPENFSVSGSLDQISILYNGYNRTLLQKEVGTLSDICAGLKNFDPPLSRVILCGTGRAGLWCLLAAPAANAVAADCGGVDLSDDRNLLATDLFCPGLRNIDTFNGAAILAAPHPLLLHNAAGFPSAAIRAAYETFKSPEKLSLETSEMDDDQIADWISRLKL